MQRVNPCRITFARERRLFSKKALALASGITDRCLRNYENGETEPDKKTIEKLSAALHFPRAFFYCEDDFPQLEEAAVSFRRYSKTTKAMRASVLASGAMAFKVNQWLEEHFYFPQANLPDLSELPPEEAAMALRYQWGLGNAPVANMVHLLEAKGVRIFSLGSSACAKEVDAFCTWHKQTPFVFLNTQKSAERSRFDAAHELGHLVRDLGSMKHNSSSDDAMEKNANAFASAFLMPSDSLKANRPPACTAGYLMKLKKHYGVSLAALVYRMRRLDLISEWSARMLWMELAKKGYLKQEPQPMPRETSQLLSKAFSLLQTQGKNRGDIARSLHLPVDEIHALTFGLTPLSVLTGEPQRKASKSTASLRLIS